MKKKAVKHDQLYPFGVTLFRSFLGKFWILSSCRLSLNASRISKTKPPPSLCFVCLTHVPAVLIRYFKLNTGCQDGPLCKNGNARVNFDISNQNQSNHFYCHITTAQVPW